MADVTLALGGALSALSSAGVCSYSGLYIVNLGTYTYKVTAISGSITFSLSSSSFAIADKVNHIIASVSTPLLTIYFDFDLTVNIYGYSGNAFLDFATITLATNDGSMIGGYSVVTTNIGFHTFNIYFTTLVSNLRITVNGVSLDYSSFNTWHLNILTSLDAFVSNM